MLTFPDETRIRVIGLVEVMAEIYAEGRQANATTAEEIIAKLEAKKNYIPSSEPVRKEFAYVLLKEYRNYVKDQTDHNRKLDARNI